MTPAALERWSIRAPLLLSSGAACIALLAAPQVCSLHASLGPVTRESALMFAAMMLPLVVGPIRHVCNQSLARRRWRAAALFLVPYTLLWIAAGVVLMEIAPRLSVYASVALIALWQFSPAKQFCVNRCHAFADLSAFGIRADYDALAFGSTHAVWCIASCSGLMLLPMLLPAGQVIAMAVITIWLLSEKLDKPAKPQWALRGPAKAMRIAQYWITHSVIPARAARM